MGDKHYNYVATMDGCGWCDKTKEAVQHIPSIHVAKCQKDSKDARCNIPITGFPAYGRCKIDPKTNQPFDCVPVVNDQNKPVAGYLGETQKPYQDLFK
jgi:hypothetical protein